MRFNTATCLAVCASAASALPGFFSQDVMAADDKPSVPGTNPLVYCNAEHNSDIVSITSVDLSPNPPEAGSTLEIKATGTVFEPILEGAYINLVVKYGLIRLINQEVDLCEQTEKADLKCPIEKGVLSITKSVEIPKEVPPGKYTVHAEVLNADDKPITCLEATVQFGGSKSDNEL
ncbi:phosphatidylinositol/phosphatidylglycerol transfer protein [Apiospora rasikravindrae]|uniref:Phosphatidylglycerol/phosphatidylinositol transfer protein n=1 Tax=Apiospora rasikravindrae TaxID=990691 RepID=A0ABR1TZV3_9PEZI